MSLRLKLKIPLFFLLVVLFASAINLSIASFAVRSSLTDDLINRIATNSQALISDLTNYVLIGNKEGVINLIYNQKASHKDVSYMLVVDENDQLLASTLVTQNPETVLRYNMLLAGETKQVRLVRQEDGLEVYDIALRLDYNKGTFRVGYFKKQIEESILGIIYRLLFGVSLSVLLALILAWFFTKGILKPLYKLRDQAHEVSEGNLGVQVDISSKDEVGDVAIAFNEMTKKLAEIYQHLDDKVKEKTTALTEQIKETELRAEELKKFQLAVENTSQHIIITDLEGVILYANPAVAETTGYTNLEVIGKKPSLWGGQMPKEFFERMWRTIKIEKKTFSGEVQNKRKNGELYTAAAIISPIINSVGEVRFFIGLETDISKQKAFERALEEEKDKVEQLVVTRTKELKEERARLLASINSLSFGFIISDMEDHVILANKAMNDLFGFKEGDTIAIDRISSLLGEHFDLKMQIERCFEDRAACEMREIVFGTKFLRGIIAPISTDADKTNIGYVLLFEDVTEAKVIERSREEFFAVASHELRTPLTAIRGNMEMFKDFGDTLGAEEKKDMITDTYDASIRLIGIVNDFLDTSRLEQGKTTFGKESVDLLVLIRETCKEITPLAEAKGLVLSYVEPNVVPPTIIADNTRMKQVISNFVDNAVKYTEKGSVTVTIAHTDKEVTVSVMDTGKGISPKNQTLLFRKFQQAGEEMLSRDVSKSTGLGLYISKLIVEAMGGKVRLAKSALGEGSAFEVTMPITPVQG